MARSRSQALLRFSQTIRVNADGRTRVRAIFSALSHAIALGVGTRIAKEPVGFGHAKIRRTVMREAFCLTALVLGLALAGCGAAQPEPTGLAAEVAGKARQVADQIGGPDGFGGPWMNAYSQHMADHMGFHGMAYLADPEGDLNVEFINDSEWPCTFHLAYVRGEEGLEEQYEEITVPPGGTVDFQMPCAEIVGIGSVDEVGAVAADVGDDSQFDNWMCVPGFLNSDYLCGGTYACALGPDVDDLDNDGDTQELIVTTEGMWSHMGDGGMRSHMNGMWSHMDEGGMPGRMFPDGGWFGGMMGGGMMGGTRR
jgi:hypothetical protein